MNNSWIKIYTQKLINWEWYTDIAVKVLFLHCLLKADHCDTYFRGRLLKSGSFKTTTRDLENETGLTRKQIERAKKILIKTGTISTQGSNLFTVITVENWGNFQDSKKTKGATKGSTKGSTDVATEVATNVVTNRSKNYKNTKNIKKIYKKKYGEFDNVELTDDELEKLKQRFTGDYKNRIEKLSVYLASTGRSYKSHYATILAWDRRENPSTQNQLGVEI